MIFASLSWLIAAIHLFLTGDAAKSVAVHPFDSPELCTQVITPLCNTTFAYIDQVNAQIRPSLVHLVETPYFRHFKLDLDKQCKFWNAQHFCVTENCAVEILPSSQFNWSDVTNEELKPSRLGEINQTQDEYLTSKAGNNHTCEDLDYCHIDDDHNCVYLDLIANPERFTGYGGNQSFDIWKAIYSENCFPNTSPMSMSSDNDEPESCIEKNLFYRLVSGMHASIAVHLSNDYLFPTTGKFGPNLKVFMEKVGYYNDRLSNIYFNYAIVGQALERLTEYLPLVETIESSDDSYLLLNSYSYYKKLLGEIIPVLQENPLFDGSKLFVPQITPPQLKEEFRARFKNVSAIMDCVGCDRCRLWGKVQTIGYGTALKVLFESTEVENLKFRRIELVALVNTFDRLSKSLEAISNFKKLYLEHLDDVKNGLVRPGELGEDSHNVFDFPFLRLKHADEKVHSNDDEKKQEKTRLKIPRKSTHRTFKQEVKLAYDDVVNALIFVLKSYVFLPKFLYRISIVKLSHWWDNFIGRQEILPTYEQTPFDEL